MEKETKRLKDTEKTRGLPWEVGKMEIGNVESMENENEHKLAEECNEPSPVVVTLEDLGISTNTRQVPQFTSLEGFFFFFFTKNFD